MIFKAQINPRDFSDYFDMIEYLRIKCFRLLGVEFSRTDIRMGQMAENSELCWFKALVDDGMILDATRKRFIDGEATFIDVPSPGHFYKEFTEAEYENFEDMLQRFQQESVEKHGSGFDETTMRVYRLHPASQIFAIAAHLYKHAKPSGGTAPTVSSLSAACYLELKAHPTIENRDHNNQPIKTIDVSVALAAIARDRAGAFADSPKRPNTDGKTPKKSISITIEANGLFPERNKEALQKSLTEALLRAINDTSLWEK